MELKKLEICLNKIVKRIQNIKNPKDFDKFQALLLLKLIMTSSNGWMSELIKYNFDKIEQKYLDDKMYNNAIKDDELHAKEIETLKAKLEKKFNIKFTSISEFGKNKEFRYKSALIFNTNVNFSEKEIVDINDKAYKIFYRSKCKTIESIMIL